MQISLLKLQISLMFKKTYMFKIEIPVVRIEIPVCKERNLYSNPDVSIQNADIFILKPIQ